MARIDAKGEKLRIIRESFKQILLRQQRYADFLLARYLEVVPRRLKKRAYNRRVSETVTKKKGYLWHVHPHRIEIDITYRCNRGCIHCNRSCGHAPSDEEMSVGQIEKFLKESVEQKRQWQYIKLSGGEPTLHSRIFDIVDILFSYKKHHSPGTKIAINTNNFGRRTKEVLSRLPAAMEIIDTDKDSDQQNHFLPFNIAPLDHPYSDKFDFATGCCVIFFCGFGLTKWGYYPCAVGGAIDRILDFDIGKKELPSAHKDWPRKQLRQLCRHCGLFLPYEEITDFYQMSGTWRRAYENYRKKKPSLTSY